MSISNSREFLAWFADVEGFVITDHRVVGRNVQLDPGTYPSPDWDNLVVDSVTFAGTSKGDALFGGGNEIFDFFMGSRGDDLYGVGPSPDVFVEAYVDYSGAPSGVVVDMTYTGSRTFTDADGDTRTVDIVGRAFDGFGGIDYFAEIAEDWGEGFSSISGVFGSAYRDVMIGGNVYGGGGNDHLVAFSCRGGTGNDRLIGKSVNGSSVTLRGDEGNDWIFGTDRPGYLDVRLVGGAGNDHIFAGAGEDRYLTGDEGDDFIDAGAGNDFMDGGVDADRLLSGAGNDIINPDVEYFQLDPDQPRDGARDVICVTKDDLGAYTDTVLFSAFEEVKDEVRFGAAVRGGIAFRVTQQENAGDAGRVDTILQIDQDGDGFGGATPDADDYFLKVLGADLSLHRGYLLT